MAKQFSEAEEVYGKIQSVPVGDNNGYPNNVTNTQTKKKRGCGAAKRGCMYSANSD